MFNVGTLGIEDLRGLSVLTKSIAELGFDLF
jgi:hypothetical protein